MEISTVKWTGEKPAIAVFLDDKFPTELKPFFCVCCGKRAFDYYSNVRMLYPGEVADKDARKVAIIQCKNTQCRALYTICQTIKEDNA